MTILPFYNTVSCLKATVKMNRLLSIIPSVTRVTGMTCYPKNPPNLVLTRSYKRHVRSVMKELYYRRIAAGPEPERPRSVWPNWNYGAEIFAFGKRLNEDFSEETLRTAFVHKSYIDQEVQRRQELQIDDSVTTLAMEDNSVLAYAGRDFCSKYITAYLQHLFPKLPEVGIASIHNHLLSEETTAYISTNLGTKDLILSDELFPSPAVLSKTLMAVVGALLKNQGDKRAQLFVQDFILTQLHGKELIDFIDIVNPMGVLADILNSEGKGAPEPRLLWHTGTSTVVAAYIVGIYSDKQLVGQSAGETLVIAEELAARDALRKYFGLMDNMAPLKFGGEGHALDITC